MGKEVSRLLQKTLHDIKKSFQVIQLHMKMIKIQSNTLKSNIMGKNIFLQVICYLTYLSTTHGSNFAERTST